MKRAASLCLTAALLVVPLTGCATELRPATADSDYVEPEPEPTVLRDLTSPGDTTRTCIDALDDGLQEAFDVTQVDLTVDSEVVTVRWTFDTGAGFHFENNLDFRVGFQRVGSGSWHTDLRTFIGGGERVKVTTWGGMFSRSENSVQGSTYDLGSNYAEFTYPVSYIEHLGPRFAWSAQAIYNSNGHDRCGTTGRMLEPNTDWLTYE